MARVPILAAMALALSAQLGHGQTPPPVSDSAKELVGAWEISDAERSRRCPVTFSVDPAPGGFRLDFDPQCGNAFPPLKDVVAWMLGQNDVLRLIDARRGAVLEFSEVENGLYEGERPGEGLYFLQTQAAIKTQTRTAEDLFGDWDVVREIDKPLCTFTLSNSNSGSDTYKLVVKPGCDANIAGIGLTTWRLDRDQLLFTGPNGNWRFAESDPTIWERVPLSTDPLLLMKR
jgi:Protease inhibitor Inh